MARVVASIIGFAERAEEVAQRLVAEEVEALVGDFKADFSFIFTDVSGLRCTLGRIAGLLDRDVVFLLHALHDLFR